MTWNLNSAFTSAALRGPQWDWISRFISADIAVLTEAQVPNSGLPEDWQAVYQEGGIGSSRRWGTIVAARNGYELRDITNGDASRGGFEISHTRPGTVVVVDVLRGKKIVLTVVGVYAMTTDLEGKKTGNGDVSMAEIMTDLKPLFESKRRKRLVIAGDLNLLPGDVPDELYDDYMDVVMETERTRWEPGYCCACASDQLCGHMWTHWNKSAPERVQNIDYVFASKKLYFRLGSVKGGRKDFPEADQLSDHAPIVAEFHV